MVVNARRVAFAAATVTAIGLGAGVAQAAPVAHAVPANPRVIHRCGTARLGLSFRRFNAGAGQRFLKLVLINQSHATCSIGGYPRLRFYGAYGHPIASHEVRVAGSMGTVSLLPGGIVRSCLQWGAIQPPFIHPHVVAVAPPGNRAALIVAWKFGPVMGGRINVGPLKAGTSCP